MASHGDCAPNSGADNSTPAPGSIPCGTGTVGRRLSGHRSGAADMDRLQSEYESLQQKLALLRKGPDNSAGGHGATLIMAGPNCGEPLAPINPQQQQQHQPAPGSATMLGVLPAGSLSALRQASMHGPLVQSSLSLPQKLPQEPSGGIDGTVDALQLQGGADALAALESLRFSGRYPGLAVGALAAEVFEDTELVALCSQGLGAQLTRTKEGATAQSRILELAGEFVGNGIFPQAPAQTSEPRNSGGTQWKVPVLMRDSTARSAACPPLHPSNEGTVNC